MFSAFVWSEFQTYVVENKGGDGKMIMYQSVSVCIRSTKCTVAAIACLIPLPASFSGLLAIRACQSVGIKKCLFVPIHPTTKSDEKLGKWFWSMHLANPLVVNESHWNEDISQNLLHCKCMIYRLIMSHAKWTVATRSLSAAWVVLRSFRPASRIHRSSPQRVFEPRFPKWNSRTNSKVK